MTAPSGDHVGAALDNVARVHICFLFPADRLKTFLKLKRFEYVMTKCHSNQDYGWKMHTRSEQFTILQLLHPSIKYQRLVSTSPLSSFLCYSNLLVTSNGLLEMDVYMNNTYQRTALQTSHNPDLLLSWHSGRRTLADSFPSHSSRSFARHNWLWSRRVHYRCNEVELVRGFCLWSIPVV